MMSSDSPPAMVSEPRWPRFFFFGGEILKILSLLKVVSFLSIVFFKVFLKV